jgi:hypothetical protein
MRGDVPVSSHSVLEHLMALIRLYDGSLTFAVMNRHVKVARRTRGYCRSHLPVLPLSWRHSGAAVSDRFTGKLDW